MEPGVSPHSEDDAPISGVPCRVSRREYCILQHLASVLGNLSVTAKVRDFTTRLLQLVLFPHLAVPCDSGRDRNVAPIPPIISNLQKISGNGWVWTVSDSQVHY
jgi:hypothetical protein